MSSEVVFPVITKFSVMLIFAATVTNIIVGDPSAFLMFMSLHYQYSVCSQLLYYWFWCMCTIWSVQTYPSFMTWGVRVAFLMFQVYMLEVLQIVLPISTIYFGSHFKLSCQKKCMLFRRCSIHKARVFGNICEKSFRQRSKNCCETIWTFCFFAWLAWQHGKHFVELLSLKVFLKYKIFY